MKTNILVEYKGGGYSGCFWEWNYFYIDENGEFHDVFSSGRAGITNKQDGQDYIDNDPDDVYIYHLDNKEDMKTFAKESACPNVKGVVKWFNDYNSPIAEPFAICSECGIELPDADEIYLTDIHGCGGIASTADNLVCPDCYTTCDNCGEYSKNTIEYDEEYLCEYCIEDAKQQKEYDNQADLLFQCLTTGTPDMFSDDMRWFWI